MIASALRGGIDTWSPCWYLEPDSPAGEQLDQLALEPAPRGRLLPGTVGGHRVGWVRPAGLLYAEGHPAGDGELCPPDRLGDALAGLVGELLAAHVPVPPGVVRPMGPLTEAEPGFGGIRRLDATVNLPCARGAEGLAILAGVAGLATVTPRVQARVHFAAGARVGVETVTFHGYGGRRVLGRWYDKGLESGAARRGELIRAEDQRRFPRAKRRDVGELSSEFVRQKFCERFLPLWRASKGVTVAGQLAVTDRLAELVRSGELSARRAEQLAGYVVLARSGVRHSRATTFRRQKDLRELGLVVAEGGLEDVEIDLRDVLDRALDGASWAAQG